MNEPADSLEELNERFAQEAQKLNRVREEIANVIIGQQQMIERFLLALLCNGHVLIEGIPGLAKTLAVTTLAKTIHASFRRVQFTPDLLPGDLTGTMVFNPKTGEFAPHQGPLFGNIILADEINRSPAKVQSALLEAMQEHQITIGDFHYKLEEPFLVLATQNPIEQEGTYQLPEAQIDRFLFKLKLTYPPRAEEHLILQRMARTSAKYEVEPVMETAEILRLRGLVDEVHLDEKIEHYILDLVQATRDPAAFGLGCATLVRYGASPRATIALALAAKGHAFLAGRGYVIPQDVKDIAPDTLRHRVITSYEALAEQKTSDDIILQILDGIKVP